MLYSWSRTGYPNILATVTARDAAAAAREAKSEVEFLKFDVERLLMITEALWGILKEKHGYDDDELIRRIEEIDLRDDRLDGRVAPTAPPPCPKCNHPLTRKRVFCVYCGTVVSRDPFER